MAERVVPEEEREHLEAQGDTGYGTSFPLGDCDEVRRAVQSYGRAPTAKRAQLRRAIVRRHRELGCSEPLPEEWM
jgi:hypothetical protein